MKINQITNLVNSKLAGERLPYQEIKLLLDSTIDDINTRLNACLPVFSDLDGNSDSYDALPDRYIRSVVVPGAALKFYNIDEEGADVAPKLEQEYLSNLFYLERDYLLLLPEEYVADMNQGLYHFSDDHPLTDGGVDFDGRVFFV